MRIKLLLPLLSLWLASCATFAPPQQPAQNQPIAWSTRAQTLSNLTHWDIKGLVAVRTQADAWSADLSWQQNRGTYTFSFFGPLGTSSFKLSGYPGLVTLETADGKNYSAPQPDILLAQQTGWKLPVSNLYYWVRGLPAPGRITQKQFDAYHHVILLQQHGWTVRYLRYNSVNGIDLPSKIFLEYPTITVKIIISEWQIR